MATSKKTKQAPARMAQALPAPNDLMGAPDITATAAVRFSCGVYVKVTHPDYKPQEIVALLGQGQVQMEPLVPGQVGTLILDGFPYTVLGYYTFSVEDADFEQAPVEWSFHGTANDKARGLTSRRRADSAKTKTVKWRRQQGRGR